MPDRKFRFTHSSTSPVQIHIHTDQNSVFQTNKHTKKENSKGNGKKKEEKPLIAQFSTRSQFLIFFLPFLCITIWFDCLSLAWDGGGSPYDLHWIASFSLPLCRNIGWHFLLERENVQQSLMTKDG